MTKPKTQLIDADATTNAPLFLYDADAVQTVPLEIVHRGKTFRVAHVLAPLTDQRWLDFDRDRTAAAKHAAKVQSIATDGFEPNARLWDDLAQGVKGFAPDPDWKRKSHIFDKTHAINALLHAVAVEDDDDAGADELLSFDDEFVVDLDVLQSGTLGRVTHYFREETRAEMDEYLAITTDKPRAGVIAKFARESSAERLIALYDACVVRSEGYDGRVPAWHKTIAIGAHFARQFVRMGKF